jgi:hypothetical protein
MKGSSRLKRRESHHSLSIYFRSRAGEPHRSLSFLGRVESRPIASPRPRRLSLPAPTSTPLHSIVPRSSRRPISCRPELLSLPSAAARMLSLSPATARSKKTETTNDGDDDGRLRTRLLRTESSSRSSRSPLCLSQAVTMRPLGPPSRRRLARPCRRSLRPFLVFPARPLFLPLVARLLLDLRSRRLLAHQMLPLNSFLKSTATF